MKENNKPISEGKKKFIKKIKKIFVNRYFFTGIIFILWMTFIDNTSWLVVKNLNQEINKYEEQLIFYKNEFERNDAFYKKLMQNKHEKEKYARENYFMKRRNEEIFILVMDTATIDYPQHTPQQPVNK